MKALSKDKLDDPRSEANRREHTEAIEELQGFVRRSQAIIANVELVDGIDTPIAHRLGRVPTFVNVSVPRGLALTAGVITEVRGSGIDRRAVVVLRADGYGATITVDLECR